MNSMHQIRKGISKAWDSVTEGWREIRELAGDALTRFQPDKNQGNVESLSQRHVARASRWGLLAAEVADEDKTVTVRLEAPGLDAADFDIEVSGDLLIVRGEKKASREEVKGRYHVMERAFGRFERSIQLPAAVDESGATAKYRAGVLTVTLPKLKSADARRIKVTRS